MAKLTPQRAREIGRLGGRAVIDKEPPASCPKCGRSMGGRTWHSYLGHLSLHKIAEKYPHFGGDPELVQKRLRENGIARGDPAQWNGAFKPYRPLKEAG